MCGHRLHCLKPLLVTLLTTMVLPLCPSGAYTQFVIPLLDVGRERLVFSVCVCVCVSVYVGGGGVCMYSIDNDPSINACQSECVHEWDQERGLKAQVWFTTRMKHFRLVYNTVTVQWLLFMWWYQAHVHHTCWRGLSSHTTPKPRACSVENHTHTKQECVVR